jgi:apolipoprotein N-acyltransferase
MSNGYVRAALGAGGAHGGLMLASVLMLPFGSLLACGRRRRLARLRIVGVVLLFVVSAGLIAGCGSSTPGTPAGTSNVTITATSGSIMQTSIVALTVQ